MFWIPALIVASVAATGIGAGVTIDATDKGVKENEKTQKKKMWDEVNVNRMNAYAQQPSALNLRF